VKRLGGTLLLVLSALVSQAQWQLLSLGPGNTDYKINDLCFINDSVGFAACWIDDGSPGAICKTVDGALTWTKIEFPNSIKDIDFVSIDTGYSVGIYGRVYRTVDQGVSWQLHNTLSPWWDLKCIYFKGDGESYIGAGTAYCMTCAERLLHSGDGWLTFDAIPIPTGGYQPPFPDGTITQVYFMDSLHGYALNGFLMRTDNGGDDWYFEDGMISDASLYDIASAGNRLVIAGMGAGNNVNQQGLIKISDDLGETWYQLPASPAGLDTCGNYLGVAFVSDSIGYAVGGPKMWIALNTPNIIFSTDGGSTWHGDDFPFVDEVPYLLDVTCPSNSICYAGGYEGTVFRKQNANLVTPLEAIDQTSSILKILTNPFENICRFTYTGSAATVLVYNQLGQLILSQAVKQGIQSIDLVGLPTGLYILQVGDGRAKLLKQ
jgi:photosystem II stability/assembly factor-like uncharacterized protein